MKVEGTAKSIIFAYNTINNSSIYLRMEDEESILSIM